MSTVTQPGRHLFGSRPHHYVSALDTDIRRSFRRWRLLAGLCTHGTVFAAHERDVRGMEVRFGGMLHEQREQDRVLAQARRRRTVLQQP